MNIPILEPSGRQREYTSYSDELRSAVIRGWLFSDKTHRQLDEDVLGLDKNVTRGYQSMGILHYLGLKAPFHGIFKNISELEAINHLKNNVQNFGLIITLLTRASEELNLNQLINEETAAFKEASQDTSEARKKRIKSARTKPERLKVFTYTYRRNPDIVVEALLRAGGTCEYCKNKAPFNRASDGSPYLEVHHIVSLADGGEDTLENVLALCPNCHREKHFG
jgi:5-methylcytosine-specific restriction enzyme A